MVLSDRIHHAVKEFFSLEVDCVFQNFAKFRNVECFEHSRNHVWLRPADIGVSGKAAVWLRQTCKTYAVGKITVDSEREQRDQSAETVCFDDEFFASSEMKKSDYLFFRALDIARIRFISL